MIVNILEHALWNKAAVWKIFPDTVADMAGGDINYGPVDEEDFGVIFQLGHDGLMM